MVDPSLEEHVQVISLQNLAEGCGVNERTVRRWVKAGQVNPCRRSMQGRTTWFTREEVEDMDPYYQEIFWLTREQRLMEGKGDYFE